MRKQILATTASIVLLITPFGSANAHPGRTDANGGHYCWTNCAKWGLQYGEYHYPNGGHASSGGSWSSGYSSGTTNYSKTVQVDTPAEPSGISVSLPSFNVTVNGTKIINRFSKYPIIVYKDITYFPMTWNYTQALGLDTAWSADTGFSIRKGKSTTTSLQQESGINSTTMIAQLPDYNIFVNDSWVDNSKEDYPILTYKDITYFPMTWNFASDQLGLSLDFNQDNGLSINRSN